MGTNITNEDGLSGALYEPEWNPTHVIDSMTYPNKVGEFVTTHSREPEKSLAHFAKKINRPCFWVVRRT